MHDLVYLHAVLCIHGSVLMWRWFADRQKIEKKRQSISWRQQRSHFFSSPLAANLASFISISLLSMRLLKLQHVLGLFHFISNGLAFSVTEEKRISEKNQSFENGFSSGLQCLMWWVSWRTRVTLMQSTRNQDQIISSSYRAAVSTTLAAY